MTRKIKETPILTGKDAIEFERQLKLNETKKVPKEHYDRALKTYLSIKNASP